MATRVSQERAAIAELQEHSPWLTDVAWQFEGDRLVARFKIALEDRPVALKIVYPSLFPDTAPSVMPLEDVRLSTHQYGEGGELCLEFRPDNWEPTITGAMMIASAYRLLSGESSTDPRAQVPNAHDVTVAQSVRGRTFRFLPSEDALAALGSLELGTRVAIELIEYPYAGHWLAQLTAVAGRWKSDKTIRRPLKSEGFAVRIADGIALPQAGSVDKMIAFLKKNAVDDFAEILLTRAEEFSFILLSGMNISLYMFGGAGKHIYNYKTLSPADNGQRLPEFHALLTNKTVAIIGCGSVGSKIAASLARCGVGQFYLFDGDILQTGNLVRNELDTRAVGLHKADAVAERIFEVAPAAKVKLHRSLIGGQESAGTIDLALSRIARADLVIDATADGNVHNLCGSAARREAKPFLWVEVFGGGIGGLVVRCRPHLDPVPHLARRQILAWCDQEGVAAPPSGAIEYEAGTGSQIPVIADDADVSVIASHATRMAIDTLLRTGASIFPNSAYAIGLSEGWIFTAPFDTRPIPLAVDGLWGEQFDENAAEHLVSLLKELASTDGRHEG